MCSSLTYFKITRFESEHIKKIIADISTVILSYKLSFPKENLVGMDDHLKNLSLGLDMESNDVRMIMIYGIGGIGKTSIAQYLYDQISWRFECCSFLQNVERTELIVLQNQLLKDTIVGGNEKISNTHQAACVIENSLHFRKALIVFDNVDDDTEKLELLVGTHNWFGKGSRIIITTRNKHLLNRLKVDHPYEVKGLKYNEALKLFSQYAFGPNFPKDDFKGLINGVIHYCQGLPLALKVLGSNLSGRTIFEWESQLDKLESEPERKIHNVLKTSYDGLDRSQQMVFLDIACFFEGEDREFTSKILDGCKLHGEINIRVLLDRCLINVSDGNKIYMHDLIQQMGWQIVREAYPEDPSKWSRLWNVDDIYEAFISEEGMQNVETISLDLSTSKEIWLTPEISAQMKKVFIKMKKLRLLKIYFSYGDKYKMVLPNDFEFPPNLRYLHWEGLESLPWNVNGKNLVAINLKSSNMKELWGSDKCLAELKFFDVSNSQLRRIPEFSSMPRLEKLNLEGCISFCSVGAFHGMKFLRELNLGRTGIEELPSSIGSLSSLEILNLSGCSKFEKFPEIEGNMKCLKTLLLNGTVVKELPSSIGYLEALRELYLCDCSKFEKFPEIQRAMEHLQELFLDGTAIKELPNSIDHLTGLAIFNLENCKNLTCLPSSIYRLKNLLMLSLNDCSNLEAFPEIMVNKRGLCRLYASGMAIKELPSSIGRLKGIYEMELINCENLATLPDSIGDFEGLYSLCVRNCSKLHKLPDNLRGLHHCLTELDLAGCNLMDGVIPGDLWCLSSLRSLDLSKNNICHIPAGIIHLSMLEILLVNHCLMLKEILQLPSSLKEIAAHGCPFLETLSCDPTHLLWSTLLNSFKLNIEYLRYEEDRLYCSNNVHINIPAGRSGIPEWVTCKSMGCEVSIELSENWYEDDNFLGFALFSHLLPVDDDNEKCNLMIPLHYYELSISHGDQSESKLIFSLFGRFNCRTYRVGNLGYPNSNDYHVYHKGGSPDPTLNVLYVLRTSISAEYRLTEKNHFKVHCSRIYKCGDITFKVKSCGIHPLYAQPQASDQERHDQPVEDDAHRKRARHV